MSNSPRGYLPPAKRGQPRIERTHAAQNAVRKLRAGELSAMCGFDDFRDATMPRVVFAAQA